MKSVLHFCERTLLTGALTLACGAYPALGCTVNATGLGFGSINPLSTTDATGVATITVSCTTLTSYTITMSAGGGGSFEQRVMRNGGDVLDYQIYSDLANSVVWGDGSGGTSTVSASASGAGTTSNAYGRVPHQPSAFPGTYTDTIIVTINY
jgi:spore coat protein U-like protein